MKVNMGCNQANNMTSVYINFCGNAMHARMHGLYLYDRQISNTVQMSDLRSDGTSDGRKTEK